MKTITKKAKSMRSMMNNTGESVACTYLLRKGYTILDRNYLKKFGEIDIVAEKAGVIHFIEVKTIEEKINPTDEFITPIAATDEEYKPEENVHLLKLRRLATVIQAYILEKRLYENEFTVDVIIVTLKMSTRRAKVEVIHDIVL